MNNVLDYLVRSALIMPMSFMALPTHAHHSFAMFDQAKNVEIAGVVKEFQWTNPHTWIQLDVSDKKGKTVEWAIEGGSPNILKRQGWKSTTLKSGDRITVTIHPLKDGSAGGALVSVKLPDGSVIAPATTSVAPVPKS